MDKRKRKIQIFAAVFLIGSLMEIFLFQIRFIKQETENEFRIAALECEIEYLKHSVSLQDNVSKSGGAEADIFCDKCSWGGIITWL